MDHAHPQLPCSPAQLQQQRPNAPIAAHFPPATHVFLDQYGRRRPTVAQELDYFHNSNEPYQIYKHYEAPFAIVTMSDIETTPVTDLYKGVTGKVKVVRPEDSEEEQGEGEEDGEEEEGEEQYVEDEVLGKEEDWANIGMIASLPIGRKACEALGGRQMERKVAGEEEESDKDAPYEEDDDIDMDLDMELDSKVTISPPNSTRKHPPRFSKIPNTSNIKRTSTAAARATSIKTHKGIRPIPAHVQQAAAAIWDIKKNRDGLPIKTVLWTMDGFVTSKGHMKRSNPLREWLGDERLFDGRTWAWLVGK